MGKTIAPWIWLNAPKARPASACTLCAASSRSFQSLSRTKARPRFCPCPEKLNPATPNTLCTTSLSCVRKYSSTCLTTSSVCSVVVPSPQQ